MIEGEPSEKLKITIQLVHASSAGVLAAITSAAFLPCLIPLQEIRYTHTTRKCQ